MERKKSPPQFEGELEVVMDFLIQPLLTPFLGKEGNDSCVGWVEPTAKPNDQLSE